MEHAQESTLADRRPQSGRQERAGDGRSKRPPSRAQGKIFADRVYTREESLGPCRVGEPCPAPLRVAMRSPLPFPCVPDRPYKILLVQVGTLSFSHPSFGVSVVFIYLYRVRDWHCKGDGLEAVALTDAVLLTEGVVGMVVRRMVESASTVVLAERTNHPHHLPTPFTTTPSHDTGHGTDAHWH